MASEVIFPLAGKRIWVAGHRGMVGSAIVRRLASEDCEIITTPRADVDLKSPDQVRAFAADCKPDAIFMAAAKVGGILANDNYPADFLYDNLMIAANVTEAAYREGVGKMLFLGSSCIYPKEAPQPIPESALLTGPLEPTNEPYAIAKIAGIKLCESHNRQFGASHGIDYRSVMPTNLYGPGDNYHPDNSHVVPALLQRFHRARVEGAPEVTVWGSGRARREFLYVDDMADACLHVMALPRADYHRATQPMQSHLNVGAGHDIAIGDLAALVARTVGYTGAIRQDATRPDGAPQKLLDVSRLASLGWTSKVSLEDGLALAFADYLKTTTEISTGAPA